MDESKDVGLRHSPLLDSTGWVTHLSYKQERDLLPLVLLGCAMVRNNVAEIWAAPWSCQATLAVLSGAVTQLLQGLQTQCTCMKNLTEPLRSNHEKDPFHQDVGTWQLYQQATPAWSYHHQTQQWAKVRRPGSWGLPRTCLPTLHDPTGQRTPQAGTLTPQEGTLPLRPGPLPRLLAGTSPTMNLFRKGMGQVPS